MRVYRSIAAPNKVIELTASRHRDGSEIFLKDFTGSLMAERYAGYGAGEKRLHPVCRPKAMVSDYESRTIMLQRRAGQSMSCGGRAIHRPRDGLFCEAYVTACGTANRLWRNSSVAHRPSAACGSVLNRPILFLALYSASPSLNLSVAGR